MQTLTIRSWLLAGCWTTLTAALPAQTLIQPDDPNLDYSEYVNATISATEAKFNRSTILGSPFSDQSPGTRIRFTSDATTLRIQLEYVQNCGTPRCSLFPLIVDGVEQSTPFGSTTTSGAEWFTIFSQPTAVQREFCVVFPYASEVRFLGLELGGGTPSLLPPPAPRPAFLYVAYGDSITQGYSASSITSTYPHQVGEQRGWSVLNMGFFGRITTAADGTAVGNLGGDLVTVEIGINDWYIPTTKASFESRYNGFLNNLRAVQPAVPIYALTPTWYSEEGVANSLGYTADDYRQFIRNVVIPRTATDTNLYLVEGSTLVPPGLSFFPDGIHPSDTGFDYYTQALIDTNRVVNPGFEDDLYAWINAGGALITTQTVRTGTQALEVGPGGALRQPAGRLDRGQTFHLAGWSRLADAASSGQYGVRFLDPLGTVIQTDAIAVTTLTYRRQKILVQVPAGYATAEFFIEADAGSTLFVDGLEMVDVQCPVAAMQLVGSGVPGTLGTPTIGASALPVLGNSLSIDVGNSLGVATTGVLYFAALPAAGERLFNMAGPAPLFATAIALPAAGYSLPLTIPVNSPCGAGFTAYATQLDPGASGGLAITPLLILQTGF